MMPAANGRQTPSNGIKMILKFKSLVIAVAVGRCMAGPGFVFSCASATTIICYKTIEADRYAKAIFFLDDDFSYKR